MQTVPVTNDALPRLPAEPIQLRSPLEIIQHALNAKLAPAELREYFELYRTMKADEAAQAYAEAMNACQGDLPGILRDKDNSRTGKKYASYESLNGIIKPIYTKHGFSLSFGEEPMPAESSMLRIYCEVRHRAGHKERYQGDFPRDGKSAQQEKNIMTALQGTGSTYSYARRYLAKNIFNLAEMDEDNDGNAQSPTIGDEQVQILNEMLAVRDKNLESFLAWAHKVPKTEVGKDAYRLETITWKRFVDACNMQKWPTDAKASAEAFKAFSEKGKQCAS